MIRVQYRHKNKLRLLFRLIPNFLEVILCFLYNNRCFIFSISIAATIFELSSQWEMEVDSTFAGPTLTIPKIG